MKFYKYNATGNDFILLYNAKIDAGWVKNFCHRKFGIGADGVFNIKKKSENELELEMFNSDGSMASMCANGSRSSIHFAHHILGMHGEIKLNTPSGVYNSKYENELSYLEFPKFPELINENLEVAGFKIQYINSGCEQAIIEHAETETLDINEIAPRIRHFEGFPNGANVNFYYKKSDGYYGIRTFEKGCETETLSCGTGVTATASYLHTCTGESEFRFSTKGGELFVSFKKGLTVLFGKVALVYTGEIC